MPRVLLLLPTTTYRTKAFMDAASRIGAEIVAASEVPSTMQALNPRGLITLDFLDPEIAAHDAAEFARNHPIDAVIPVDEDTAIAASRIADELHVPNNPAEATATAKNKYRMRTVLKDAGIRVPRFWHFSLDDDLVEQACSIEYPCVIKPLTLSTSRGVMRVDNEEQLVGAVKRLEGILEKKEVAKRAGSAAREVLAEEFIPGFEVAVEGLLTEGKLKVLAIFDKPDPLDGPFFEETIYVTPSRLSYDVRQQIAETTEAAARAMGLTRGPIHAELRINEAGPWVIEVAARAIGGLCSRTLRFGPELVSLEELIIRHALGEDLRGIAREKQAAGVMMIPIPRAGTLREVQGLDRAKRVRDVEDVVITAHVGQAIAPPPEGSSYLGFIFSRAETPERAEAALREAHKLIEFIID